MNCIQLSSSIVLNLGRESFRSWLATAWARISKVRKMQARLGRKLGQRSLNSWVKKLLSLESFRMVWILAWHRALQHFCCIFCCISAGWRAIWVHPPACAGSSFDMASVDKSTPSLSVEAEVDRVAEAQWILSDPETEDVAKDVGTMVNSMPLTMNSMKSEFTKFSSFLWLFWMLGLWYWEDLVDRNDFFWWYHPRLLEVEEILLRWGSERPERPEPGGKL